MLYPDINLQKKTQQNTTRYRTALYLRLSREDGDKTESDSIANQRTLLEAYVMYLSQNVVETFIDRIEVFNDEHVKIHFTFENVLADYAE